MSDEKNMTEETTEKKTEKKGSKKSVIILEIILALVAVGCIGFAVYKAKSPATPTSIDGMAFPTEADIVSKNPVSLEECESLVASGDMIKLSNKDGSTSYVINFTDSEMLKNATNVSEADIDELIYREIGSNNVVDAPADKTVCELYDVVSINYLGKIDGVAFEGGTAENQTAALGAGMFIDGFEDQIVGMSIGEVKDIYVTFPENYGAPDLAGKDAVFTITLNDIISVPAELTDDMIPESYASVNVTTIAELKDYYREYLKESIIQDMLNTKYYVSSVDNSEILAHYESVISYYENMSTYYKKSVEELVTESGQTYEDFKKEVINNSTTASLYGKSLRSIAEYQGLTVDESKYSDLATAYGCESVQALFDQYGEQIITDYLIGQEVIEYLKGITN